LLVNAGADLNVYDKSYISPLLACIIRDGLNIADYLLSRGAKIEFYAKNPMVEEALRKLSFDFKLLFHNHTSNDS